MGNEELVSVDDPVESLWFEEGGGPGNKAFYVLVHKKGYTQEFWFYSQKAAEEYVKNLRGF